MGIFGYPPIDGSGWDLLDWLLACLLQISLCYHGNSIPRKPRCEAADPDTVQVFHLIQRCVRRAWLCGDDPASGQSFEHRRGWICSRLDFLVSVFGIHCLTYTVFSNHMHLVLRTRPDAVAQWSYEKVARRWLKLFPDHKASLLKASEGSGLVKWRLHTHFEVDRYVPTRIDVSIVRRITERHGASRRCFPTRFTGG